MSNSNSSNSQMDRMENTLNHIITKLDSLSDGQAALRDGQAALTDGQAALTDGQAALIEGQAALMTKLEDINMSVEIGFSSIDVCKKGILLFLSLAMACTGILLLVPSSAFVIGALSISILLLLDVLDIFLVFYICFGCKICVENAIQISKYYTYLLAMHTAMPFISSYRLLYNTMFFILVIAVIFTLFAGIFLKVAQKMYVEELEANIRSKSLENRMLTSPNPLSGPAFTSKLKSNPFTSNAHKSNRFNHNIMLEMEDNTIVPKQL